MENVNRRGHDPDHVCGRREHCSMFDDELIEAIAEKAADKAISKLTASVYQEIGKGVVSKALYIVGAGVVAFWLYLKTGGHIK